MVDQRLDAGCRTGSVGDVCLELAVPFRGRIHVKNRGEPPAPPMDMQKPMVLKVVIHIGNQDRESDPTKKLVHIPARIIAEPPHLIGQVDISSRDSIWGVKKALRGNERPAPASPVEPDNQSNRPPVADGDPRRRGIDPATGSELQRRDLHGLDIRGVVVSVSIRDCYNGVARYWLGAGPSLGSAISSLARCENVAMFIIWDYAASAAA